MIRSLSSVRTHCGPRPCDDQPFFAPDRVRGLMDHLATMAPADGPRSRASYSGS